MKKRPKNRDNRRKGQESKKESEEQRNPSRPSFRVETLEPRILLSATWVGTDGDDTHDGTDAADHLEGHGGNDVLHGGIGDDILDGGGGHDQLFGDEGNDILISGGGDDVLSGGGGDDTFQFTGAQAGDVITVTGGKGNDALDLSGFHNDQITEGDSSLTVDLGEGQTFTINHSGIESIVTGDGTYTPGSVGGIPVFNGGESVDDAAPTADAGADQTVDEGHVVTLDASHSSDPEGQSLTFHWTQTSGPAVSLNDDTAATPTFSSPDVDSPTTLTFQVEVSDGTSSHMDTVDVLVNPVADVDPLDSGLVGHWTFDSDTTDASGNGHDLTWQGADGDELQAGHVGSGAMSFDGENDLLRTPDGDAMQVGGDYSSSVWINPEATQNDWAGIYTRTSEDGLTNHYNLQFDNSADRNLVVYHNGNNRWDTGIDLDEVQGDWHHVSIVREGDTMSSFLDGELVKSETFGVDPGSGNGHFLVGAERTGSSDYLYSGQIDDLRVYDHAVTAETVAQLAAMGPVAEPVHVDDAPTAHAGDDQTVNEGDVVTLDASHSSDPEGQSLTYEWVQTSGPTVTLSDAHAANPTFTAPEGVSNSDMTFELHVSDGTNTSVDTVNVTVNADDDAPTAHAGDDQTVNEGDAVTLDASHSSDPEGQSLTYEWVQTGGPTVTLSDATAASPTFSAPDTTGISHLTFEVTVTDPGGAAHTDTVEIDVHDPAEEAYVHGLTYSQFKNLSADQVDYLTSDQIATIPNQDWLGTMSAEARGSFDEAQVQALDVGSTGISLLTADQRGWLTQDQVQDLTYGQFQYLNGDQVDHLTPDQIATIPNQDWLGTMSAEARGSFDEAQVQALDVGSTGISLLTPAQREWLTEDQVQDLTYGQFQYLNGDQVDHLTPDQIATIPNQDWLGTMSAEARGSLDEAQVQALNVGSTGISLLTPDQREWLTEDQVQDLTYGQFRYVNAEQVEYLTPEQISTIPNQDWLGTMSAEARGSLDETQVQALNVASTGISLLTPDQREWLTEDQVQDLTYGQFRYVPVSHIADLTPAQIATIPNTSWFNTFSADQKDALTHEQIRALNTNLGGVTLNGTSGNDVLTGGTGVNNIIGRDGDDVLSGGDGNDVLDGGVGTDAMEGGAGNDLLIAGGGNDVAGGGAGDDTFTVENPQDGDVYTFDGNEDHDTIDLSAYASSSVTMGAGEMTVDLGNGQSFTIHHSNMEEVIFADGAMELSYDAAPIVDTPNVDAGLVGHWNFNEGAGLEAADSVGGTIGTLTNMSGSEWNGGLEFDGVDDYIHLNEDLSPTLGGTATVSAWIRTTQTGAPQSYYSPSIIGNEQSGGTNDIRWGFIDNQGRIGMGVGNDTGARSAEAVNDGEWHHVAFTRNADTGEVAVYVDGELSSTFAGTAGTFQSPLFDIGRTVDYNDAQPETSYFQGSLDEIRVYDRTLSAAEISQLAGMDVPGAEVDQSPMADAGADQVVSEGDLVTLNGSGTDPESQAITYQWIQTDGPSVTLSDASASNPTFTAPDGAGGSDVTFELHVSDGTNTSVDTMIVSVQHPAETPEDAGVVAEETPPLSTPYAYPDQGGINTVSANDGNDVAHDAPDTEPPGDTTTPVHGEQSNADGSTDTTVETHDLTTEDAKHDRVAPTPSVVDNGPTGDGPQADGPETSESDSGAPATSSMWDGNEHLEVLDPTTDFAEHVELAVPETDDQPDFAASHPGDTAYQVTREFAVDHSSPLTPSDHVEIAQLGGQSAADVFHEVTFASPVVNSGAPTTAAQLTSSDVEDAAVSTARFRDEPGGPAVSRHDNDEPLPANAPGDSSVGEVADPHEGQAVESGVAAMAASGGFLARLWGAIRGFGGSLRREDEELATREGRGRRR
ncbi:MAG: LEPR-XLL domain-containing protein [Phycisphaerae bacterium]|nr:LEPR-XLL domain-containing protein [Phycisphaerae bacterium]